MWRSPSDVLKVGQEITAKVVDFNGDDKKISLSMKALREPGSGRGRGVILSPGQIPE